MAEHDDMVQFEDEVVEPLEDAVGQPASDEEASVDDGFEYYEMEYDEDDIVAYLEDEDGVEIGIVVLEDGQEVEYYYADDVEVESESDSEDDAEYYEMEYSEDDIVAYLEDEDGVEIGIVVLEDGQEVEYYYADDGEVEPEDTSGTAKAAASAEGDEEDYDLGITREGAAEATKNLNEVVREGVQVATDLKDAVTDITDSFNFLTGKKK